MQFNTGKQFDELVSNGLLSDLDEVAAAGKWREVLPPAIVEATTRDGKFYAVPVNIHGENWLWYNKKVFDEAGHRRAQDLGRGAGGGAEARRRQG